MANYVFDTKVIHETSCKHLGEPLEEMFANITADLSALYPGKIDTSQPWIYSNAGGVMIQMKLYHATTKEYIMIWGTPIGSEGHTGRNLVTFYDTVLDGEAWYYREGQFERDVYKPGDYVIVSTGEATGMHYPDHVWMIEYARGPLLTLLPFGLSDGLFSTLDYKTVFLTVRIYFTLLFQQLTQKQKALLGIGAFLAAALAVLTTSSKRKKHSR